MSQFGVLQQDYDAVLFLENSKVVKEMLYSEFEAVLDGVVGEPEYANHNCTAVYLKLNKALNLEVAIFFTIEFAKDGTADPYWDIPLRKISETANMAEGPVRNGLRIVCSSQCPMPWYKDYLWEPDLSVNSGLISTLERCIKKNRLGFVVDKTADSTFDKRIGGGNQQGSRAVQTGTPNVDDVNSLNELLKYDNDERVKFARALKKLRLQMNNLKQLHQQKLEEERKHWQEEKVTLLRESHQALQSLEQADTKYKKLLEKFIAAEENLRNVESDAAESLDNLNTANAVSSQSLDSLHSTINQLKEQLELRELEVHYRDQKIEALNQELSEIENETGNAPVLSDDNVLSTLSEQGVHFVLTLPAVGPISIAVEHMSDYIRDPMSYMAARFKMDKDLYEAWYQHAQNPVCTAHRSNGEICGAATHIGMPHDFISGVSDQCEMHKFRVSVNKKVGNAGP